MDTTNQDLDSARKALATHCRWDTIKDQPSEKIEEALSVVGMLGHGSLGLVDQVKIGTSDTSFVRKRILLPTFRRKQLLSIAKQESKVVEDLVHTHIIHVLGTYEHTPKSGMSSFSILMFPVGDRDLSQFLLELGETLEKMVPGTGYDDETSQYRAWLRRWFLCLISGLSYIHSKGIRHQDIKPSNIIHRGEYILFTDFSSSGRFQPGSTTSTESPSRASDMYSAPEVLDRLDENDQYKRHGTGSDIFSLGCVFAEMLSVLCCYPVRKLQDELHNGQGFSFSRLTRSSKRGVFCYSRVTEGMEPIFKKHANKGDHLLFKKVIAPMLRADRKRRPSAREIRNTIYEPNFHHRLSELNRPQDSFRPCSCLPSYLPGTPAVPTPSILPPTDILSHRRIALMSALEKPQDGQPQDGNPPDVKSLFQDGKSEQLPFFKDYYSNDDIHPNDLVSVLWAYQARANDEFALERGDMLRVVGIWDDGWGTGVKYPMLTEEYLEQPNSKLKLGEGRDGEIKAFPLVCVCLPQHWKTTIEGKDEAKTGSKVVK